MNILLNGATGKVGRCIEALAADDPELTIVGRGERNRALPEEATADVVIDFSRPAAMIDALRRARGLGLAFVSGTTGLDREQREALDAAAEAIPVCHAANFAIGVHVLQRLVRDAAEMLGGDFDIEIVEAHHRRKADAPSGTALDLGRAAARGRQLDPERSIVTDVHAGEGSRASDRIGIQSLRGGDIVGEHCVQFLGHGERVELVHRATDRSLFARGALAAARRLIGRPAGRYGLEELLFDSAG